MILLQTEVGSEAEGDKLETVYTGHEIQRGAELTTTVDTETTGVWKGERGLGNIVKPMSKPMSKSQIQVLNPGPKSKSKIQSPEERDWDWD